MDEQVRKGRQIEAALRNEARSKRTTQEQIALAQARRGNSAKELKRLREALKTPKRKEG